MSGKAFALGFIPLFGVGLTGAWLLLGGHLQSGPRFAAGLCLTLGAVAGLLIVFRRELRETEAEKRARWAKVKAHGKRSYVVREALRSIACLLLPAAALIVAQVLRGRPGEELLYTARMYTYLAAVGAPLTILLALWWWHRQEKRYAGAA
jgi:ABC-type dipeptide/oligopeptide/nickel transport system permease component